MSAAANEPITALEPYREQRRWVTWRNETRGPNGKITKVPYNPATRKKALADDPATWGTRAQAQAAMKSLVNGQGGGVGIELGDLGNGSAMGGIDLDTCRDAEGAFTPWAIEVMALFPSYTEVSPSGTGAKILFLYHTADLPMLNLGTAQFGRAFKRGDGDHPPSIELYLSHRYFAVTDDRLPDAPDELAVVSVDTLKKLLNEVGPAFAPPPNAKGAGATGSKDASRSATAFRKGAALRRSGVTYEAMVEALRADPDTAGWAREKGDAQNQREFKRIWERAGDRPQTDDWPSPFYSNPDGIWFARQPTKADDEPEPIWVCAPFNVIAETTDEHGTDWGLLLSWKDRDGGEHYLPVKRRLFHAAGNEVAAELDAAGLTCGTSNTSHELLKRLLSQVSSQYRKRCVTRGGWHKMDSGIAYVLPSGETFGPHAADLIMQGDRAAAANATRVETVSNLGVV